ncbi:OmpA family protein [uncultured Ilyobacter sp.]|uniref:OmpA family protein n=1 Tax=uncultured Ilyobacter sp. TaxID=544433 RepID=UPI002AA8B0AB|nr:OmpA family protein [uncultured Ilyobacter sp.]
MRKKLLIGAFIAVAAIASAAELELKLGADLYRDLTEDASGHNPVKIYPGGSAGLELLVNEDSPFRFGIGAEAKSSVEGSGGYDGHYAFPVYGVGKYDVADTWYLLGRAGYAFAKEGDADDVIDANGGLYGAVGVGKEFMDERFNLEFMYELMDYDYDTATSASNEDGLYHVASLKFGIKFGGPSPAVAAPVPMMVEKPEPVMVVEPEPEPVVEKPAPAPEPVIMVPEEGLKLRELFSVNSYEVTAAGLAEIDEISQVLVGHKGTLTIEGNTDSTGSAKYNMMLSEKRAEAVANEFKTKLEGEEIEIVSKGFGEENPLVPNTTPEAKAQNRRVEVFWDPAE